MLSRREHPESAPAKPSVFTAAAPTASSLCAAAPLMPSPPIKLAPSYRGIPPANVMSHPPSAVLRPQSVWPGWVRLAQAAAGQPTSHCGVGLVHGERQRTQLRTIHANGFNELTARV